MKMILKGGVTMKEIRNPNGKRVCDASDDGKRAEIFYRGCKTIITANPDCTLNIEHMLQAL